MKSVPAFLIIFLFTITHALADDWPRWRGPNLDGISTDSSWRAEWPDSDPPLVWKTNVGTGLSGISIANNKVYTIGNNDNTDTVFCLNADTGKEIWTHSYPAALDPKYYEGGPGSTPTVDGDTVFTIGREGQVFSLNAESGEVNWSMNLVADAGLPAPGWGFNGSPLVLDDRLFLNAGTAGVALDKSSGAVIWKSDAEEAGYSSPYPLDRDGKTQLLVSSSRSYSGVDPETGAAAWTFPWLTRYGVNAADPVPIDSNTLFISSGYGKGAALIRLTGTAPEEAWKSKEMGNQMNPCLLIDGYLYGVNGNEDGDPEYKCLAPKTGDILWSDDSTGASGAIAANGYLIILGERGELIIAPASPDEFDPITRIQVLGGKSWTAPSLANGRVYCRNIKGDLVCVDLR
ncbi:MAG: PQQ-binding-like beta-propeller repeat protein [Verrucomicrobiota bacterium]